eukprot:13126330-Alexandrium_andersonii.AAC.1
MPGRRTTVATPAVPPVRGRGRQVYKRPSSAAPEPEVELPDYELGYGVSESGRGTADSGGLTRVYDRRGATGRMKSAGGRYLSIALVGTNLVTLLRHDPDKELRNRNQMDTTGW